MAITYLIDDQPVTKEEFVARLREEYVKNPPIGYTAREIRNMKDEDLLDMDYFLHE